MNTNCEQYGNAFSPDYATACARFRAAAAARGARLESLPIGLNGPHGEELAIDVALLGAPRPRNAVVLSCGLHGVEGFLGSAVEVALLERALDRWTPPEDSALILIHALNPYGFAWLRRFDPDNVDLNRNFLVDGERFEGSPRRYSDLNDLINPSFAPSYFDPFWPNALWAIGRYGLTDLKQAIAGGQYDYPRGLFFGGRAPAPVQQLLGERLPGWLGGAAEVIHLDFHTGLGPWATYKLLLEPEMSGARAAWLQEQFGPDRVRVSEPDGVFYRTRGGLGRWCQALFPECRYDFLCAEFGTYSSLRVLAALRVENQTHHWAAPNDPATRSAKARLKEVFGPSEPQWRNTTVQSALAVVRRALEVGLVRREEAVPAGSWSTEKAHPG